MTYQNATKATLLVIPLLWASYILTVVLYTGALLVTSSLVRRVNSDTHPGLKLAVSYLRSNRARWTSFILRMLVALIAAGILLGLSAHLLLRPPLMGKFNGRAIGYAIGFALEALVALSLMRPALRLLSDNSSVDLEPLRSRAIVLGLITIALQLALTLLGDHLLTPVLARQTSISAFFVIEVAQSLLGALTYLPLFIGLSLLVESPANEPLPASEPLGYDEA